MATTAAAAPTPAVQAGTKFEYWKLTSTAVLPPPYPWKKQPAAAGATPPAAAATPVAAAAAGTPAPPPSAAVATGAVAAATVAAGGALGAAGGGTAAISETPKEYIKKYFETTEDAPFGSRGKLAPMHLVSKIDVIRAAISAGYGNRLHLNGTGHAAITVGMRRYLSHRLEMLLACLDFSGQEVIPKSFFEHVEATEKGALAFIAGCLGTHIAARVWMASAGTFTKRFLHTGIYTKATAVLPSALVKWVKKNQKGKIPDFLVQDGNSLWHVFESKGGNVSNRWTQLIAGLEQLVNVSSVGAVHQTPAPPTTTVCVQTVLEHRKPISIVLVDPPAEGNGATEGEEPAPTLGLTFVPGVAEMLAAVEALDWYHGLSEQKPVVADAEAGNNSWQFARTTAFGGLLLGIPRQLLRLEPQIRAVLGRYLAVQQTLEMMSLSEETDESSLKVAQLPESQGAFTSRLSRLVDIKEYAREVDGLAALQVRDAYNQIAQATSVGALRSYGALYAWSLHLDLGGWAAELDNINAAAKESLGIQDGLDLPGDKAQVTEGGLYLRLANG